MHDNSDNDNNKQALPEHDPFDDLEDSEPSQEAPRRYMLVTRCGGDLLIDRLDGQTAIVLAAGGQIRPETVQGHSPFKPISNSERMPIGKTIRSASHDVPHLRGIIKMFKLAPRVLTHAQLDIIIRVWFVCHFLRTYLPTRPIIAVTAGEIGATKTSLARAFGRLLLGSRFQVSTLPKGEDDFYVQLNMLPYAVIDNAESPPKWFPDALSRVATGATYSKRELYSDDRLVSFDFDSFLAVTCATPEWFTGYMLDRMVIIRVAKPAGRIPEGDLQRHILQERPYVLAEAIVIAARVHEILQLDGLHQPERDYRMADFAAVGALVAQVMDGADGRQLFLDGLTAMQGERVAAANENDPLLAAIMLVATAMHDWLTTGELFRALNDAMGAVPEFGQFRVEPWLLGGDAGRLSRELKALRTRALGLVDIQTKHVDGTVRYLVRMVY